MTDETPIVSAKDLARTYDSRTYGNSWELVEDYWRVMDYAARRPELGSQALASRLELPHARVFVPGFMFEMANSSQRVQTPSEGFRLTSRERVGVSPMFT